MAITETIGSEAFMQRSNSRQLSRWLSFFILYSSLLFGLYGCSGSGTEPGSEQQNSDAAAEDAQLVVSLTDAEGDFLSYTVDVVSLKMLNSNGAQIETLPLTTRIDFAQYVEVTEFLTAATVPAGHYVGAQIVLDFTDAEVVVQDENGEPVTARVQDVDGNPVTQMTVDVSFNGDEGEHSDFVIAAGIPANITLDFDLDASNEVLLNGTEATVIVSPTLLADTILEDPKSHRLRGLLAHVSLDENIFSVALRPFHHRQQPGFGELDVHVGEQTSYEINGEMFAGSEGLVQLDTLDTASAVLVLGEVNPQQHQFTATEVYAGSSVPWGDKDIVSGNVIARSGNVLTVRGATLIRADGSFAFNDNVSVTLNADTTVVKQADVDGSYSIDDISVGQHITVLGRVNDEINLAMEATHVRMLYTTISGVVTSASPLAIDLQSIDRRRIRQFDFSGTGTDSVSDADSDYYEVDSGALSLANLQLNDPVKVRGFVTAFATAPEDFTAQTILDAANMRAHLVVGFGDGSGNAIAMLSEEGLLLNLDEAGEKHHLYRAGISTDLLAFDSMPLISPPESGSGLFVITQAGSVRVYTSYSSFLNALTARLDGDTGVKAVHAHGTYDANANSLRAGRILIRLSSL